MDRATWPRRLRAILIGGARDFSDQRLFHKVSLAALLAWVGLGADGLSSSCYGPEETFKALGANTALAPFVALACVVTIAIICASYSQIIELFPGGGGGYLVASKLLSPAAGVVSGCALLVDYVLTITISIASGADAFFSLLPAKLEAWKLPFAAAGILFLTILNLRGVRESVLLWVPVFFVFLATHATAILLALATRFGALPEVYSSTVDGLHAAHAELGWIGVFLLVVRAYSMGAGTFTGIEAVSNGLPVLREPRVATGKRTMVYMGTSLAVTVGGLLLAYLLYGVRPEAGKTLNAVLFEGITATWPAGLGTTFVSAAMLSATALLFIAAQAGFLDGPRVLANMALDRWVPARFASLSDRLVAQNGVFLMGGAAVAMLLATGGSVALLVVLYSINVFITFSLSQLGMVRHWWSERARARDWKRKLGVSGVGFCLTTFILVMLSATKFWEGGWVTLVVTGVLVGGAFLTKLHYRRTAQALARLDALIPIVLGAAAPDRAAAAPSQPDPSAKTAVLLVNGFNGLGVHTLHTLLRMFPGVFRNFVFVRIGVVDAGNFKGATEIEKLRRHIAGEADRYAEYMRRQGFHAEAVTEVGTDVVECASRLAKEIQERYSQAIFFGGQIVFEEETWATHLLHNFVVFAIQRRCFRQGLPFLIVPLRL